MNAPVTIGSIGHPFDFIFPDTTSITAYSFFLMAPDGTETEKTTGGSRVTGTDDDGNSYSAIRYLSGADDFPVKGTYRLQIEITTATYTGRRESIWITVHDVQFPKGGSV